MKLANSPNSRMMDVVIDNPGRHPCAKTAIDRVCDYYVSPGLVEVLSVIGIFRGILSRITVAPSFNSGIGFFCSERLNIPSDE